MPNLFKKLVQVGFDIIGTKYYATGVEALYFYDYFLTLQDEVEYAWQGKKTWLFYLFILVHPNALRRMDECCHQPDILQTGMIVREALTACIIADFHSPQVCDKTSILALVFFAWATLVAQVFLIVRIYALTRRNRIITGFFVMLTTAQSILGAIFLASPDNAAIRLPEIKLEPFYICLFASNIRLESAYTSVSLAFDSCAFITIVVFAYRSLSPSSVKNFRFTGVVRTVVQDATIYFAVIFSSHLILTMFIFFARDSLKLTPASGNNLFLPMMVSRLVLSLKKSVGPRSVAEWRVDHFSRIEATDVSRMNFAMRPVGKRAAETDGSETLC
ncbi:hypothetical protein BDM02DRAFT_3191066 [Thelephora ganbajun]|uniref:Uncharacterized protein n=1 Tax=Thelephora ganbajun TaxID=370292 RepID=A0ACB6Z460_THEGA|nr:hypothetical protein BDM02DRAFT_3191066 [Thelephora ganbajun]